MVAVAVPMKTAAVAEAEVVLVRLVRQPQIPQERLEEILLSKVQLLEIALLVGVPLVAIQV